MNLVLDCPSCGNRLEIGEEYFGRKVLCNVCKEPIQVPRVEAGGAPPPENGAAFHTDAPPPRYRDPIPPPPVWTAAPPTIRRLPLGTILVAFLLALLLGGGGAVAVAVWISHAVTESAKEDIAKAQIRGVLVPAVERYRLDERNNPDGGPPSSLEELLDSDKASLAPDQLMDPWGRPYQYAPESSHDAREGYDIWTQTPSGTLIGNWKW